MSSSTSRCGRFSTPGDEILVPSPDYPLWTAAVTLNRGSAVHYECTVRGVAFVPDPEQIEALITRRTRAIVVINPNNPTGAGIRERSSKRLRGSLSSIILNRVQATRSMTR